MKEKETSNKNAYILIVIVWIFMQFLSYYEFPYFIIPFFWLLISLILLIMMIRNLYKLIRVFKSPKWKVRSVKLLVPAILLFLTVYKFNYLPQFGIEKLDWVLLFNKRMKIVEQVKQYKLNPNVSHSGFICELPFEYPIVSNGGNDIGISRNSSNQVTVDFYIFRNFFEAPSSYFIYTNRKDDMEYFDKKIIENPDRNWKINDNWYRIMEE